jgi:hypothetical protein
MFLRLEGLSEASFYQEMPSYAKTEGTLRCGGRAEVIEKLIFLGIILARPEGGKSSTLYSRTALVLRVSLSRFRII